MKKIHLQSGFTLLEVMMALLILSVALLGLASLSSTVIQNNSYSNNYTTATLLAQDKLEELLNRAFTHVDLEDANTANNTTADFFSTVVFDSQDTQVDETGTAGAAGGVFTRTVNIWPVSSTRKDIAVILTWEDDQGNTRTVSLSTIKSS